MSAFFEIVYEHPTPLSLTNEHAEKDQLTNQIVNAISESDIERLKRSVAALNQKDLPSILFDELSNTKISRLAESHLWDAIVTCLMENRLRELKQLLLSDSITRSLILNRHAFATMAPRASEIASLVFSELRFTPAGGNTTIKRCSNLIERYEQAGRINHRHKGNLCYEARAITYPVNANPETPEERIVLTHVNRMLRTTDTNSCGTALHTINGDFTRKEIEENIGQTDALT